MDVVGADLDEDVRVVSEGSGLADRGRPLLHSPAGTTSVEGVGKGLVEQRATEDIARRREVPCGLGVGYVRLALLSPATVGSEGRLGALPCPLAQPELQQGVADEEQGRAVVVGEGQGVRNDGANRHEPKDRDRPGETSHLDDDNAKRGSSILDT